MKKQLVFIDDSGDPGFKIKNGSGRVFVIACVVFDNEYTAGFADASIRALKSKLDWPQNFEFKFHRTNDKEKKEFFINTKDMEFSVWATVVDKTKIEIDNAAEMKSFYQKIITATISKIDCDDSMDIHLDGKGDRNYRNSVVASIRKALIKKNVRIRKFKFMNSKDNNLVQLADMIAGAIRAENNPEKRARQKLIRLLKGKKVVVSKYDKRPEGLL